MIFVDYAQIVVDAVAAVTNASLGFAAVLSNANDRDFEVGNMPMVDIRVRRAFPEALAGRNDYVQVVLECEVATFDLTSLDKAAKMRDNLVSALQRFFQLNPRFSGSLDTTTIGATEFFTGENISDQGAFGAGAILEINVFLYVNG